MRQQDRNEGQTPFDRSPPWRRFVSWRSEREPDETGQADTLRYGTGQALRKQGDRRIELQERVVLRRLPRIEPDDIKEESPRHDSWPGPNQPGGSQNNEHRRELIEQQNNKHPSVIWPLLCNDIDLSCWSIGRGSYHEFSVPLVGDEAEPSQRGHRTRASQSV